MSAADVIWHDLECGSYREDLALWRELADASGDPILDVGAGTGRVTLDLAAHGHRVTALDRDPVLLDALRARAGELPVDTVLADARTFSLGEAFALCLIPMQTVQLLGDASERARCLAAVRAHLRSGGRVAVAISEALEPFDPAPGSRLPLPDIREHDGTVYSSQPTAVRAARGAFILERRREIVDPSGHHEVTEDRIELASLSATRLEREARMVGLEPGPRRQIPATPEYVGSTVVTLHG